MFIRRGGGGGAESLVTAKSRRFRLSVMKLKQMPDYLKAARQNLPSIFDEELNCARNEDSPCCRAR